MRMVSRDGVWRVDQITVTRHGRTVTLLRVHRNGIYVGEAANVEALADLEVPIAELVEPEA